MRFGEITRIFRLLIMGALAVFILSCSSHVRTTITTFKDDSSPILAGTFRILPLEKTPANHQLQFDFYKEQLEEKFKALGYTPVEDSEPKYTVYLTFSTTRREKNQKHSDVHFRGVYSRGHHSSGVIVRESLGREFEYARRIQIGMEDVSTGQKVVEVDAISFGDCNQMPSVFSSMLDAIFKDFWRAGGTVEKVVVPNEGTCK